ncbi:MAG: glycosyltransferase [Opitutae bacterium]|nr:glycosyltransferase [Opitutae bacterium]
MSVFLSVVLPTHNPHRGRLVRTLAGLRAQTMPVASWEMILVDNASAPALDAAELAALGPANLRIVRETALGLTPARRRGFSEARSEFLVLVDDDNVLAPDYLDQVAALFAAHPKLGAAGGKNLGEFETPRPAWWQPEFDGLLACRDAGDATEICTALFDPSTGRNEYPLCAPVGAGMALRRAALATWLADDSTARLPDRRGNELSSSGDNDIVLSILRAGWSVGYFPSLILTHLIPSGRVQPDYVARLNRGIARSWVQVLHKYDANPWPPVAPWTVPLRQLKAWFVYRAWSGHLARIRWQGACGHFEGLAQLTSRT